MPTAALRPCSFGGCRELVSDGRCQKHTVRARQLEQSSRGGKTAELGYDADWKRCRAAYIALQPLCEDCLEKSPQVLRPGREVHHKVPLSRGGARLDFDNLRHLCLSCHRIRTSRGE